MSSNRINYIAKDAFYGLNVIKKVSLSGNLLTKIPFDALEVFRDFVSLQHLDLSSNRISGPIAQNAFSAVSACLTYIAIGISEVDNIDTNWLSLLRNLKHATLTFMSSNPGFPDVVIDSKRLPSLQTLRISDFHRLHFSTPMCTFFPILEVASMPTYAKLIFKRPLLDMLQAFQGCSYLKELDLSGTLFDIRVEDLKQINITILTLETLKLAQNMLSSINLIFCFTAPKLIHIDLADNLLPSIGSKIA